MRTIIEEKGELLTDPSIIALFHQVKTTNRFDAGMAAQVRKVFPEAWTADCEAAKNGENYLGNFSMAKSKSKLIYNIYSFSTADINKRYTDYDALRVGMTLAKFNLQVFHNSPPVGMGRIGCRYGNGDWNIVRDIVAEVFNDYAGKLKIIDNPGA